MTIQEAIAINRATLEKRWEQGNIFFDYHYSDEEILAEMMEEAYKYLNRSATRIAEDRKHREQYPQYYDISEEETIAIYRRRYEIISGDDEEAIAALLADARQAYDN